MKAEMEKELMSVRYPEIFREHTLPTDRTCMCWGLECGDGWFTLLDTLCKALQHIYHERALQTVAEQVKEKYGTLRFYYRVEPDMRYLSPTDQEDDFMLTHEFSSKTGWALVAPNTYRTKFKFDRWDSKIDGIVTMAEQMSANICELCGHPGRLDADHGWYSTLCEPCRLAIKEKK